MSDITENPSEQEGLDISEMDMDIEHRFAVGAELEALRRGEPGWEEGKVIEIDREGYGKSIDELPMYEVIQEIEQKWDPHKYNMVIDAMLTADSEEELEAMHTLSDNQLLLDKVPEGKDGGITWYCEFQDQKRVFDTIAAARHWFLHEVEAQ